MLPIKRRLHHLRKRYFSGYISSPFDLGSVAATGVLPNPFLMKAAGNIGISFSAGITAGQLTISRGSRTIKTPNLVANQIHRLGFFETKFSLTPSCAIAGTVTIHYLDHYFKSSPVATGTFT